MKPTIHEQIRSARNVSEIQKFTDKIADSIKQCKHKVFNLSRSASRLVISMAAATPMTDDESIKISHTGVGPVKRASTPGKVNISQPTVTPVNAVLEKFRPPKLSNVTQHTDVINELHDRSLELDSIEALLIQGFAGSRGQPAALKAIRTLKKSVDSLLQNAFTSLAKVAESSLPKEVRALGDAVTEFLINNLDEKTYDNMTETAYVVRTSENLWHYTIYVGIEGLKNEQGYVFDDYNVVLSAMIDQHKKVHYYLTTLADFRLPGKFPLGKEIKNAGEIKTVLSIMLRHNDVINVLDKHPMPVSPAKSKSFTKIPGVADATVEDDILILKLTKKNTPPTAVAEIVKQVIPMLKLLVGNKSRKLDIIWKPIAPGKVHSLHFILASVLKGAVTGISAEKLRDLQHALDLTDTEIEDIREALKHKE